MNVDHSAERMVELASQQPGFLGIETVRESVGITVSYDTKGCPMSRIIVFFLAGILTVGVGFVQASNNISVDSMPPVVVQTFPQAGDKAVDPSITEIRVTFNKEMMTQEMWSWVIV